MALLGLESFEDVQKAFKQSRTELSEILSGTSADDGYLCKRISVTKAVHDVAFEFWDNNALQMFKKHATPKAVMENEFPFYVLIETSGSNKDHDDEVCIHYSKTSSWD